MRSLITGSQGHTFSFHQELERLVGVGHIVDIVVGVDAALEDFVGNFVGDVDEPRHRKWAPLGAYGAEAEQPQRQAFHRLGISPDMVRPFSVCSD